MTLAELRRPDATFAAEPQVLQRLLLQHEVEQFLYKEAALLDARRYRDWLALLADDIHYWMPIRRTVTISDLDLEFTELGDIAFFDDNYAILEMRVKRVESGTAWAEDPPSRSRHFVSNVRLVEVAGDEITVEVCFYLLRSRGETEVNTWVGRRRDVLRVAGESFRIAKRHIFLDHTVILANNLSTLF